MSSFPPTTDAALNALHDAHDRYVRTGDFATCVRPAEHLHAYSLLRDAAIAAGLDRDRSILTVEWAAERLAAQAAATAPDPLADLRDALKDYDRAARGLRLADFDRRGGFAAIGQPETAVTVATRRLYDVAVSHGFDATCQLPVDDWAHDRLNGMYAREAA